MISLLHCRDPGPGLDDLSGRLVAVPFVAERSEWHTPQAASLTVTSFALGGSTLISSTTTGRLSSRQIAARAWRAIPFPTVT
jgi:hypothetical protein